jgi:tetratricopeptide (TPR) repeat protein
LEPAEIDEDVDQLLASAPPPAAPAAREGVDLDRAMADAASFRRARLFARAADVLRQALLQVPDSIDARVLLRDILLDAGRTEDAVEEMLAIASVYVDALDTDGAASALEDVIAYDPQNTRALEMLRDLGFDVVEQSASQENEAASENFAIDLRGDGPAYATPSDARGDQRANERAVVADYDIEDEPLPAYTLDHPAADGPPDATQRLSRSSFASSLNDVDDPFDGADGAPLPRFALDDASAAETHGSPRYRPTDDASFDAPFGRDAAEDVPSDVFDLRATTARPSIAPPPAFTDEPDSSAFPSELPTRGPEAAPPPPNPELEEALEEAEFFATRGLLEDARQLLEEQLARSPNHPLILDRLAEIEASAAQARIVAASMPPRAWTVPPAEDRSFDIAEALDALEGLDLPTAEAAPYMDANQQVDVEEVFAKFKEGVAKQISVDDSQAHYDLGVAYKEMGLLDDAIRELEIAARDAKRECLCQSMIGSIQMDRGNVNEAIDALMRALHAPSRTRDEEVILNFDLGAAYEAKKVNKEALLHYERCAAKDPNFRDVQERIRRLRRPEAKATASRPPAGGDDEFDQAFDALVRGSSR